jgi:hypothetical protein
MAAVSIAVAVAYIAPVVKLSLACLYSELRFVVEPQYRDVVDMINEFKSHALATVSLQRRPVVVTASSAGQVSLNVSERHMCRIYATRTAQAKKSEA